MDLKLCIYLFGRANMSRPLVTILRFTINKRADRNKL